MAFPTEWNKDYDFLTGDYKMFALGFPGVFRECSGVFRAAHFGVVIPPTLHATAFTSLEPVTELFAGPVRDG